MSIRPRLKIPCGPGLVACSCNLSTWETEAEGWQTQGQSELHTKFRASLDIQRGLVSKNSGVDHAEKKLCSSWQKAGALVICTSEGWKLPASPSLSQMGRTQESTSRTPALTGGRKTRGSEREVLADQKWVLGPCYKLNVCQLIQMLIPSGNILTDLLQK